MPVIFDSDGVIWPSSRKFSTKDMKSRVEDTVLVEAPAPQDSNEVAVLGNLAVEQTEQALQNEA